MQTTTPDLAPQAAEVARTVAGVRDDQLTAPTPCTDTSVAALLDHIMGLTVAFRLAAGKSSLAGGPRADADNLAADWRTRLPEQLEALVASWREPAAWEGTTEVAGVRMPAPEIAVVALNEVLIHGWDLAVATGQDYRADDTSVRACLDFAVEFAKGAPEARDAMYAPVVPVADDAPEFDRLLGQTGRAPGWTAAS
jgi:uncharacterized protein (TIGR03086 family)